jgi:hypothetical protein
MNFIILWKYKLAKCHMPHAKHVNLVHESLCLAICDFTTCPQILLDFVFFQSNQVH